MVIYQTSHSHHEIGGKARGLFLLKNAGFQVPDFLVLPAQNFENAFQVSETDKKTIADILLTWNFPTEAVVVRSSVADEDGRQHAFAGMMDSFLYLSDAESVWEAVSNCAESAFSERAMAYRKQKGLSLKPKPAVIIQKQVNASHSGIMFTTFPEFPQEIAIHTVAGFGDELTQGTADAHEYYLWKKTGAVNRKKELSEERLNATQLGKLYAIAQKIEQNFDIPQDVEFVFREEELFIVQTRPITQLIPEIIVYDNSNIQESYCGVTTPLTFSFAARAYATVYKQMMKKVALSEKTMIANEAVIQNLLGLVKGRIYYNINNWYRGLKLLPSFKQNKEDMERMMGLTEPVDFVESTKKNAGQSLLLLPGMLFTLARLLFSFSKLDINIQSFISHLNLFYANFYRQDFSIMSREDLLTEKDKLDKNLMENWYTPITNDFYVMMSNGNAVRSLKKAGINDTSSFLSRFMSGNQQLASTQPTRQLLQLAQESERFPGLKNLILVLPEDIHCQVKDNFNRFYKLVENFIIDYGDRTVGELKLETKTMRVEPLIFYKYLRNFLSGSVLEIKENNHLHQSAMTELTEKLKPFQKKQTLKKLQTLQKAIANREILRLERTRLFGMYRTLYLHLGDLFEKNQWINESRDIFFLTEDEIRLVNDDTFKEQIADRKQTFEVYQHEQVPSRVIIPFPPTKEVTVIENPDFLYGTGCFPGLVKGQAIVITDPSQDLDVGGKILCALRTDPGWAALFPACKAVLIEKGSSLSHSVILLRELGIPTIINIPNLTRQIKSGQTISIDATEGKIKLR
ncbi:MAG: hypothetical protein H7Y04_06580 [Verrucomicrobia bacterium]|nr:hypothetical protein [Cytophagales bacterium]